MFAIEGWMFTFRKGRVCYYRIGRNEFLLSVHVFEVKSTKCFISPIEFSRKRTAIRWLCDQSETPIYMPYYAKPETLLLLRMF